MRRRAAGRRHYNTVRRFRAAWRRCEVARMVLESGIGRGYQARIARELGVSRATVCRDVAWLHAESRPCPSCGRLRVAGGPLARVYSDHERSTRQDEQQS
jgi:hypothetical protein